MNNDVVSNAVARPRVLVLMGGPDAEREVSIMSGTEVAKALIIAARLAALPTTSAMGTFEGSAALASRASRWSLPRATVHGRWWHPA